MWETAGTEARCETGIARYRERAKWESGGTARLRRAARVGVRAALRAGSDDEPGRSGAGPAGAIGKGEGLAEAERGEEGYRHEGGGGKGEAGVPRSMAPGAAAAGGPGGRPDR